jgi:hypothetical protein
VSFVLQNISAIQKSYPQCAPATGNLATMHIAIHAIVNGDKVEHASSVRVTWGMSMWIAIVVHALGVEIYVCVTEAFHVLRTPNSRICFQIRQTESANRYRRGFVLQRSADDTE